MGTKTKFELRCFCQFRPLLAVWGLNQAGELYLHIKVFKGGKTFANIVIEGKATIRLTCRECYRWHKVRLTGETRVEMIEDTAPPLTANR